jgi:Kef-type K+ transport system membrane component KefB
LDEALKEEFNHEEEDKSVVGKQYNESLSSKEGTTETVVIISSSQKKDKENNVVFAKDNNSTSGLDGDTPQDTSLVSDSSTSKVKPHVISDGSTIAGNQNKLFEKSGGDAHNDPNPAKQTSTNQETNTSSGHTSTSTSTAEVDVDRIIDSHDNEYVLSKPNKEDSMGLTLDPLLLRDFTVLIGASAVAALGMEAIRQPTINGYFVAGSLVGPGGLGLIKEIVQVQSVSQIGVQLLLFTLGLEFSLSKLRAVRNVALFGGALQVTLMSLLGGVAAYVIGANRVSQGAFIGALLAMSSTSVVIKCFQEAKVAHVLHAQITIGMLVFQDCVVGLLFAFMPLLASGEMGGHLTLLDMAMIVGRISGILLATIVSAAVFAATILPSLAKTISRYSPDTFQMTALGFCLISGLITTRLGISAELGAFLAGVLLSATEQHDAVLTAVQPATRLFLALFVASTGLTITPAFLTEHLLVLAAAVALVMIVKSLVFSGVVLMFRYPVDTSFAVGLNMSQVGEFGFVLLSMANRQGLIPSQIYLLLMGTTALSLLLTPFVLQASMKLVGSSKASRREQHASDASGDNGNNNNNNSNSNNNNNNIGNTIINNSIGGYDEGHGSQGEDSSLLNAAEQATLQMVSRSISSKPLSAVGDGGTVELSSRKRDDQFVLTNGHTYGEHVGESHSTSSTENSLPSPSFRNGMDGFRRERGASLARRAPSR